MGAIPVRLLRVDDIPQVLVVQRACYPSPLNEEEPLIRRRLAAAPDTAWAATCGSEICAYLFAYRSQLGKITPLGGDFSEPSVADSLYLHDLAVAPAARGTGAGTTLIRRATDLAVASGLCHLALVAVQGTQNFWARHGFSATPPCDATQRAHLASYGVPACYMTRAVVPAIAP